MEKGNIGESFNEALIDNKKVKYDFCFTGDFDKGMKCHKKNLKHPFTYLGSSYTTYHNGVKNTWEELHHFLIFK